MAERTAVHLQNAGANADHVRRLIASLSLDAGAGIVSSSHLKVTEKSGTPNMSVDVAAGRALIPGTESSVQGTYHVENDATVNLTIAAADATNPRKDLVVAKVEDSQYSGATDAWSLAVVTGTPAASPTEPTAPANSLVLALVDVAAGATSITNANITDRRKHALVGFEARSTSSTSVPTSTVTAVPWNSEDLDTHGFGAGSSTITVPTGQGGLYLLSTTVRYTSTCTNGLVRVTAAGVRWDAPAADNTGQASISVLALLADGDTVTVDVFHETGSTLTLHASTYCRLFRLR